MAARGNNYSIFTTVGNNFMYIKSSIRHNTTTIFQIVYVFDVVNPKGSLDMNNYLQIVERIGDE